MPKKRRKTKKVTRTTRSIRKNSDSEQTAKVIGTIIAFFVTIFIALSNFSLCGSIGELVRNVVLSCFGTIGYFLPLVLGIFILINIFSQNQNNSVKFYALIFFYISIICLIESAIHDFAIENNISAAIYASIERARGIFSFEPSLFSGGVIGTFFSYIAYQAFGKVGSLVIFGTTTLITFILLFGLGISKDILRFLKAIVLFIPNLIAYLKAKKEEDMQIAIDNENILNETINKSKGQNLEAKFNHFDSNRLVLEPIETKKKTFDTSNVRITAEDIESRLYVADSDDKNHSENKLSDEKSHLLHEMKKKSINEIIFEQKEQGQTDTNFFYTDNMKPIDELENIRIDNITNNNNQIVNNYNLDNDTESFASGLRNLSDTSENKTPKEFLENIKNENLEFKNNTLKEDTILTKNKSRHKKYKFPPITLLNKSVRSTNSVDPKLNEKSNILVETLKQFGVGVTITNITVGPSITRFELKPDIGVKISKILSLEDDIKLALAASEIRIEAPIPGKSAIGVEIANTKSSGVLLGDIIATSEFRNAESKLTVAIGKDISGKAIITDLRKMPHLLIAGATGSGKSVCVNSLITSLIYKSSPEDVRLIMVDPKVVELQIYNGIPHLLIPVVTDAKKAAGALNWAVSEMTRRYNLIQEKRVRDIESYNKAIEGDINKIAVNEDNEADLEPVKKLPYIVIIIDEFADLMMVASKEVENSIMRIAQLARACGIYLVIATQRPTVNVISGSIKTNVPSRISFAVSSGTDSQTILDRRGAEKLLGHGDMLYFPSGIPDPIRVQGCYVSDKEILDIVNFVKDDNVIYDEIAEKVVEKGIASDASSSNPDERDEMFLEAGRLIIDQQNASIGMLQRRFRMGFNRAARIIDQLEVEGVVSPQDGKKPREILMTAEEFENKFGG